ncbi:MAG: DUF1697 domain-containing protein [Bacteroidia bacterium]|nr:DUF1697 domain-containing protein [Bacteroidia bacterium]
MQTYLSLLRGINVSGQKSIKMQDLKALYQNLNFANVTTYIQSGNVVFKSAKTNTNELAQLIATKIKQQYNFDVPVQVLTLNELAEIVNNNPYVATAPLEQLHVTILSAPPTTEKLAVLALLPHGNDTYVISNTTVYLRCTNGYGTTKLTNNYIESKLKTSATTRNWKTINVLLGMMQDV